LSPVIFSAGAWPVGYHPDFTISLYNQPGHVALQGGQAWRSFFMLHEKRHQLLAVFQVCIDHGVGQSPLRAPYGGIECSSRVSAIQLFDFISFIESSLRVEGVTQLTLKCAPQGYRPHTSALLHTFLMNQGYQVLHAEVTSLIDVQKSDGRTLHVWERRKLRQATAAGLAVEVLPAEQLSELYTFIARCRQRKEYALSLSWEDVLKAATRFPEAYVLFGVYQDRKLVAGALSVRVTEDVLYNFYSDHDAAYDALSPVVMLIDGMYQYCVRQRIALLDLGTSAVGDTPNFGLLEFKLRLGGAPSPKFTFTKSLS